MKNKKIITMGQVKYRKSENKAINEAIARHEKREDITYSEKEKEVLRKELRKVLREDHSKRTKADIEYRKRMKD